MELRAKAAEYVVHLRLSHNRSHHLFLRTQIKEIRRLLSPTKLELGPFSIESHCAIVPSESPQLG